MSGAQQRFESAWHLWTCIVTIVIVVVITVCPDLPFPDNPDPSQCGIPTRWGDDNQAWLSGIYGGELIQPTVLLYDSHLRFNVTAEAPHGSEVEIILYQQNPVTDYYLVKIAGAESPNEGWIPAPFLSFEPPER